MLVYALFRNINLSKHFQVNIIINLIGYCNLRECPKYMLLPDIVIIPDLTNFDI
jgi:hypothetical protein